MDLEKPKKFHIHKGPTSNVKIIRSEVRKLEDDANRKAVFLDIVRGIPFDFFLKNGFTLEDISTFNMNLQKRLLKASLENSSRELREFATETLRDTMVRLGIEKPGFRDDFRRKLEELMGIEPHA